MALFVAVMGERDALGPSGLARWGQWSTHSWTEPTCLATDAAVTAPEMTHLLVLTPAAGQEAAQIAASAVAAIRPDIRVRVEPISASVGRLVRAVELVPSSLTSPTAVFAALGVQLDSSFWGAWLPSVAKLETPAPSLTQHVRSLIARGRGFVALHDSSVGPGWVRRLPAPTADQALALPRHHPVNRQPITNDSHSFGDLPEEAIGLLFNLGLATRPIRRDPFDDATSIWGSRRTVEFVISPALGDSAHSQLSLGTPSGLCPACTEPVWGSHCPFCRIAPARAVLPVPSTPPPPPPPPRSTITAVASEPRLPAGQAPGPLSLHVPPPPTPAVENIGGAHQ